MGKIKILNFSVGKEPEVIEINNDILDFEKVVGGNIQISKINEGLCVICNDLREVQNLPNQDKYGIKGNFLVAKTLKDAIISIDENAIKDIIENIHKSTLILR